MILLNSVNRVKVKMFDIPSNPFAKGPTSDVEDHSIITLLLVLVHSIKAHSVYIVFVSVEQRYVLQFNENIELEEGFSQCFVVCVHM